MFKLNLKKIGLTSICLLALSSESIAIGPTNTSANTNKGSSGVDSGTGVVVSTPSTNQSSNQAQDSNKQGQIMSALMGAMLMTKSYQHFSKCASCSGKCPSECVMGAIMAGMGAMSFAQAKEHGNKASDAGLTASMTDGFNMGGNNGVGTNPGGLTDSEVGKFPEIKKGIGSLNQMKPGMNSKYSVDPKTGKIIADGKEYNASDFASGSAMANAGIPPGAIEGAMDYVSGLEKKAAEKIKLGAFTAANGFEEGGGGGASASGSAIVEEASLSSTSPSGFGGGAGDLGDTSANMAGMSKDYNGEPIGVSADSIFDMMTRRYNVKKQQDSFFNESEVLLNK